MDWLGMELGIALGLVIGCLLTRIVIGHLVSEAETRATRALTLPEQSVAAAREERDMWKDLYFGVDDSIIRGGDCLSG